MKVTKKMTAGKTAIDKETSALSGNPEVDEAARLFAQLGNAYLSRREEDQK